MKVKDFEQQFDEGSDITASLDLSKATRIMQAQKRVNVDFPTWMIESLDREALRLGVTRHQLLKYGLLSVLRSLLKSSLRYDSRGQSEVFHI
ncbi:type II toxin-antitoxin system BrnA family antitoxin [Methylophilus glucosoxydans]|uniref:Type II toxin-antitoxin system BrnA family antitoxin n=1 Tax=Methylophilus glucosoxydans TaxID=752553 RepID=A0ABW3GNG1_9PROT